MSDIYRGRIRIYTCGTREEPGGWHHAEIARGFITVAKSYSPNWHEGLYPEEALVVGFDAFTPEDPWTSPKLIVGEPITDPFELRRCKSTRFGRFACTPERDVILMDTMDTDILAGWLCDYDDLLDGLEWNSEVGEYLPFMPEDMAHFIVSVRTRDE